MKVPSNIASGTAPVLRTDAEAGEPLRVSLEQPRMGQDLSRLTAHRPEETPLQHAATKLAGLIAPPYQAFDGEGPAGRPVHAHNLKDYVCAALGMEHVAARIDPGLAPYLDELSKVESTDGAALPVTESSFKLLCILYAADQVPGPAQYGQFGREAFMNWLTGQLPPETAVPHDCIPDRYFNEVQVKRTPETGFANRCVVQSEDGANPVEVRSMRRADLSNLDLRNLDLRGRDLRGANLRCANLEGMDLTGVDLTGADLRDANLQRVDLRAAILRGADLRDTKLQGANLTGVTLAGLNLAGANLEGAILDSADLRRANLQGANLKDASLNGADLEGADLRRANLQGAVLENADLARSKLEGADLSGANLQGAWLSGANLRDADLRGAKLEGASVVGVNLQGAKLSVTPGMAVGIALLRYPARLAGTKLEMSTEEEASSCQQYLARSMVGWNSEDFDLNFNHRNNVGSALKNIAGLDDSCRDTKQALMRAVVGELDRARATQPAAVTDLIPSLGDVLFEDPEYLRGHDAFSAWLCAGLLGDGSTLLDPTLSDAALDAVGGHAARVLEDAVRLPEAERVGAIARHSAAIYQVLYAMRERATPPALPEVREKWTARSQALHEQYRRALGDALPTLMGEDGVYENERRDVLMEDAASPNAFPLISADGRSCVIMTDLNYRQLVLGVRFDGEMNCAWADLRCVAAVGAGPDWTFPANVNDVGQGGTRGTAAIIDQFPLLRPARQRENAAVEQGRMLALAGLPAGGKFRFLERFTAALQLRSISDDNNKMIDDEHQLKLGEIFETKYKNSGEEGAQLLPEHFAALRSQWQDDSDRTFAFRLLCMAALYTNYSSARFFGVEEASPNALRGYTEALLRKAHDHPDLFLAANPQPGQPPVDQLADWLQRLDGQAYDCTAILYGMESRHLNGILRQEARDSPLHQVWNDMIPLAWREAQAPNDGNLLRGADLQLAHQVERFA